MLAMRAFLPGWAWNGMVAPRLRAAVRAYVCAYVRAYVRATVRAFVLGGASFGGVDSA